MADTLPVIALGELGTPATDAALREASHGWGFFHLVDHGIDPGLSAELFALAARFFALPEAAKREVEMLRSPHFRGYTRLGGELTQGRTDWREQIDVAAERDAVPDPAPDRPWDILEGPNLWPSALPELQPMLTRWQQACTAVAEQLLHAWARSLGAPQDVFDATFAERPMTLLKLVRYPGRAAGEADQGVGAHKDPGVLTLLRLEEGSTGLQVQPPDRSWLDVPPVPDSFVVNTGELLEAATGGYLVATHHRVVSPPAGRERVSVPFFFNPRLDASIPHLTLPPELAADARGVTVDPDNVISDTFGDNMLKARLRAHPDVAVRHHPELVTRR